MIKVIYGKRGSGKTQRIVAMAKDEAKVTNGHVVFLEKDKRCMFDLPREIRYVDTSEYNLKDPNSFFGFVNGMVAADYDIKDIFIDAMPSIMGLGTDAELEGFFKKLVELSAKLQVNFVCSVSAGDVIPEFLKAYVI